MKLNFFEDIHPAAKLTFLGFAAILFLLVFAGLGIMISIPVFGINIFDLKSFLSVDKSENIPFLKFFQAFQTLGMFLAPAIFVSFFFSSNPFGFLKSNKFPEIVPLVIIIILMVFAIPFINYTAELNANMKLPDAFRSLEEVMRNSEDQAMKITQKFLHVDTYWGLLANIIVIALLPAIAEEFIFRGVVQRLFTEWTRNVHISVIIAAAIFSFVHFQFYGFIPRFIMGVIFGCLFVWSRNIWLPVTAHFTNNFISVIVFYATEGKEIQKSANEIGTADYALFLNLISVTTIVLIMYFIFKIYKTKFETQKNTDFEKI